jgi:polyisoprenoid-binding protein YceI
MVRKWIYFISSLVILFSYARSQTITLQAIKGESSLSYVLIHPLHRVEAISKELTCTIQYDDATHTITSTSFSADVSSFDSGNSNRDSHALEVLDALIYPTVSFESKEIKTNGDKLEVGGDLTFHGVTKPIFFPASILRKNSKFVVNGETNVSLTAFQVERPSLLFIPVKDTLRVSFTMVFSR